MASVQNTVLKADAISTEPVYVERLPLGKRMVLFVRLWAFKTFVKVALSLLRYFNYMGLRSLKPTYAKKYPVGAQLENLVWLPSTYKAGSTLPLYIDIHGGGFAISDPEQDASFCHHFANKYGFCVVSCNYRKAPLHPFPRAIQDLTEIVQAVIADPDLPVDKSKIAMGGFSAGGSLSLAVAQSDELQGKIAGMVLWYPITDFSKKYRGQYRTMKDGTRDILERSGALFDYGYIPPGLDRADPRLSPIYAKRSRLPPKLFFIGAEYDILCHEARKTAEFFAQADGAEIKGDESKWTAGNVAWKMVPDVQHGFNFLMKRDPTARAKQIEVTEAVYAEAAEWLKKEIYA